MFFQLTVIGCLRKAIATAAIIGSTLIALFICFAWATAAAAEVTIYAWRISKVLYVELLEVISFSLVDVQIRTVKVKEAVWQLIASQRLNIQTTSRFKILEAIGYKENEDP